MTQATTEQSGDSPTRVGWRVKVGFTMFVLSIAWPVVIPVLSLLGFSATAIAAFSGVMLVAGEVMLLAGAAIAGKDGFAFIKAKVFGVLKAYGPPARVSKPRYIIGLIMFCIPLAFAFMGPYLEHFQAVQHIPEEAARYVPERADTVFTFALAGDLLLICSLFVLGGDFWDKLRSLFLHDARATFPEKPANASTSS